MQVPFTKMHGLGNDFVVIDERDVSYRLDGSQYAILADRRHGIGCDQILVLDQSTRNDVVARYRVFNADGSAAEHCGNGVRCVARFLRDAGGDTTNALALEVDDRRCELQFDENDDVRVDMGPPNFEPSEIPISAPRRHDRYEIDVDNTPMSVGCVSIGNPHALIDVPDVADADVERLGAALQAHAFFPARVNVGFMEVLDRGHIKLRVFERGVGETLACGTGACAAMAIGRTWDLLDAEVAVALRGGTLRLAWQGGSQDVLWMTGPAVKVFDGIIEL